MNAARLSVNADLFGQFKVKELSEGDFWLGSATPTSLKSAKPHIVLFYEPMSVDPDLIDIWQSLAQSIAGPVIAAVNVSARGEVMDAFQAVGADVDNPLYDFTGFGYPTIIVYRSRWPQAYYNGELSFDAIKKWILVLATKPGYKERTSLYHGVRSVIPDEYVSDVRIQNFPYPTSSRDFTADIGENPRGYQPQNYQQEEEGYEEEEAYGDINESPVDVGYLEE